MTREMQRAVEKEREALRSDASKMAEFKKRTGADDGSRTQRHVGRRKAESEAKAKVVEAMKTRG